MIVTSRKKKTDSCKRAIAPVVHDFPFIAPALSGTIVEIKEGELPGCGGQLDFRDRCFGAKLTITVLDGADCDGCTNNELTTKDIEYVVKCGDVANIPEGLWSAVKYELIDAAGVPLTVAPDADQTFGFTSSYVPDCCSITVGQTTETVAKKTK